MTDDTVRAQEADELINELTDEITPLVRHALVELEKAGYYENEDDTVRMLRQSVMGLVHVFAAQGHSVSSAAIVAQMFNRLAFYLPLTALTGADDEWGEEFDGVQQNKRCDKVFRDTETGYAHNIEGIVFWRWLVTDTGERYKEQFTNADSAVPVVFPYNVPTNPEFREVKA